MTLRYFDLMAWHEQRIKTASSTGSHSYSPRSPCMSSTGIRRYSSCFQVDRLYALPTDWKKDNHRTRFIQLFTQTFRLMLTGWPERFFWWFKPILAFPTGAHGEERLSTSGEFRLHPSTYCSLSSFYYPQCSSWNCSNRRNGTLLSLVAYCWSRHRERFI